MKQPSLDIYSSVLVPIADDPPHQAGSHASWTGSRAVVETWAERQSVVLQLLSGGPKTRQELAALTPYGINGICSVIGALLKTGAIERTGDYDTVEWQGHTTRRERLRITRDAPREGQRPVRAGA